MKPHGLRGSCSLQARLPTVLCGVPPTAARTSNATARIRCISRSLGNVGCPSHVGVGALGHPSAVYVSNASPTNTAVAAGAAPGQTFAGSAAHGEPDSSLQEPYVGPVAVHVAPGACLGMFTTQAVRPGQLLALSQPLASVALRPTAVAAGPSKLIQALLQEMLNPGQRQWLQLLCDRDAIAHQQRQIEGDVATAEALAAAAAASPDGRADGAAGLRPVVDMRQLQQAASAGGQLERLQLTPLQLADMVQECAYTMDPVEAQATVQLLAAAGIAGGSAAAYSSSSSSDGDGGYNNGYDGGSGKACCALWPELAVMGRSCAPNVALGLTGAGLLVVRAAEHLPAGTQVGLVATPAAATALWWAGMWRWRVVVEALLVERAAAYLPVGTQGVLA
ncbi:hypothetical protein COO60DRAFT_140314 [Scenedesmus sp. NREL 46B-D3]|nr:hypothetical protein COO60DRAFT_140314 [Scenedesmus sp. NREL 46B-D3]